MDKRFWAEHIRSLSPYVAGEQPKIDGLIKLNTNENPYPPSPNVIEAIRNSTDNLQLYPPLLYEPNVFWGNGSDEVLAMAFMAFFSGRKLYAPDITYSFYSVWAKMFGAELITIPLEDNFEISADKFCNLDGGVIIANPNAPTGLLLPLDDVERIVRSNPDNLVIIDEAYIDFAEIGSSALPLLSKYPNLLVVRTMSKSYSLAGLRIGWAEGHSDLISALQIVRDCFNSYTLDRVAWSAANAAIADIDYVRNSCAKVVATRNATRTELIRLGFDVLPSQANFLFVTHPKYSAVELLNYLRANKILVRHFDLPRIDNYLRITIGTDEQMSILLEKLRSFVQEAKMEELQLLEPYPMFGLGAEYFPSDPTEPTGVKTVEWSDKYDTAMVDVKANIVYQSLSGEEQHLQIFTPLNMFAFPDAPKPKYPLIAYIPGSAWGRQNVWMALDKARWFASRGFAFALIEYRPSEIAPFPAQIEDAKSAIRFLKAHADEYSIDADNVAIWGDSSGGHTAVSVAVTAPELVKCTVDWYGATDISVMSYYPSAMDHYLPTSPEGMLLGKVNVLENLALAVKVNPMNHISEDKPLSPFLIMHGSKDNLVPFNQSVRLYEKLKKCGKDVTFYKLENAGHGTGGFISDASYMVVRDFIKKHLKCE